MRLILLIIITLLTLTSCSINSRYKPEPVRYTPHKLRQCGGFKYEKRGDNIILDYKVAKCLKHNLIVCCKDKKNLNVANSANIEIIEALNRDNILSKF